MSHAVTYGDPISNTIFNGSPNEKTNHVYFFIFNALDSQNYDPLG